MCHFDADIFVSRSYVYYLQKSIFDCCFLFSGLVPHCLAILKVTHQLTEKLVSVTLSDAHQLQFPETLTDLVAVARRIGSRVDDVVRSMYPPLDPRLLEAR